MAREDKLESLLQWSISIVLNLLLFTLLSVYLLVEVKLPYEEAPLQVELIEELPVREVRIVSDKASPASRIGQKGADPTRAQGQTKTAPLETTFKEGDLKAPEGLFREDAPLLSEIEQKVRSSEKVQTREPSRSSDLGNISATVSAGGIGLSGGGRATVYLPPFPKVTSEEPLSPLKIRIWIDPSGAVSRAQIIQRSGSTQVDQKMLEFVRGIRFEPINEDMVQTGVITFRFRGG